MFVQQIYCNLVRTGKWQPHQSLFVCTFFLGDFMKINNNILNILYKDAKKAFAKKEIPVSAVIIDNDGKIISHSYNTRQKKYNVLGHAEINAIIKAERKLGDFRLNDCILLTTLKPCKMCQSIIEAARIKEIYYILDQKGVESYQKANFRQLNHKDNVFIDKYQILFDDFFRKLR